LELRTAPSTPGDMVKLSSLRIGLWDTYGGSMSSGWVRFLMEQYRFDATRLYPQEIDAGNLGSKYDVIIFVPGAIPASVSQMGGTAPLVPDPLSIPEEYRS